jgi:hypothetical protein
VALDVRGAENADSGGVDSADKSIHLDLELEVTDGSLSGRVHDGSAPVRAFSGWLGLVGAIDALIPDTHAPYDKAFPCPDPTQGDPDDDD